MTLLKRQSRKIPFVNIIPLVDVLIILIFFFMMSMQFRNFNTLNITPPALESAGKNQNPHEILIGIDNKGNYFYNNNEITPESLNSALNLAQQLNPYQSVLILADEETPLKFMTTVMDLSRKAGLQKVQLQVR